MVILETLLLVVVSVAAPLVWLMYFSDLSMAKHRAKMEELNVRHARDMQELHRASGLLLPDGERFAVTYLVPTPAQPMWAQLSNRIKIYPYTFRYTQGDKGPSSKYTKTIPKSKWFYMQLKDWTETNDREAAVEAMMYLRWQRDIP